MVKVIAISGDKEFYRIGEDFQNSDWYASEKVKDVAVQKIIERQLCFLKTGLSSKGYAFYECGNEYRAVTYHTAVLAAVFSKAHKMGIVNDLNLANSAFQYVLDMQKVDGGFYHSRGDYYLLVDKRSYPRYLAMILFHLLHQNESDDSNK